MYNEHCKMLLSFEQIIVRIIKSTAKEFKSIPLTKVHEFIYDAPRINNSGSTFSINISITAPINQKPIIFTIYVAKNCELHSKHHILSNGIYQTCRSISFQCDSEFTELHKHYSIWLCFNAPTHLENCISEYFLAKRDLAGITPDSKKQYDKISIIFIWLNYNAEDHCHLTKMLNLLFSPNIPATKKLIKLENEHTITFSEKQKEVLYQMCDFATLLIEKTTEKTKTEVTNDVTEKVTKSVTKQVLKETRTADIILTAKIMRELGVNEKDIPFIIGKKYKKSPKEIFKIISK